MKKYFLVQQPPLSEKYRLLVDEISDNSCFGFTADLDKIKYNRELLGEEIDLELTVKTIISNNGTTAVFPLGCFITILEIRKDEKEGRMTFFDYDLGTGKEEISDLIKNQYSDKIAKEWFRIYNLLKINFTDEYDKFELIKPN